MLDYLLTCRSLTYAQRSVRVLGKAGIKAYAVRTPQGTSKEGCGYSVKIREDRLTAALKVLEAEKLPPEKVFLLYRDGHTEEAVR